MAQKNPFGNPGNPGAAAAFDPFASPAARFPTAAPNILKQQQQQQQQQYAAATQLLQAAPVPQEASDDGATAPCLPAHVPVPAPAPAPARGGGSAQSLRAAAAAARFRLVVPRYVVDGGFSWKFLSDAYGLDLGGLLTGEEYAAEVERLNDDLKSARPSTLDKALFFSIPMMVTAIPYALRRKRQQKLRKNLLASAIVRFNAAHPTLLMHYSSASHGGNGTSQLTIERRAADGPAAAAAAAAAAGAAAAGARRR